MGKYFLTLLFFSSAILIQCQTKNLKEEALELGRKGNYSKAIELLQEAKKESSKDPEIYYYLGVFMHYQAYDSLPLGGYDSTYTSKILENLETATKLKPDYGDAYYFIGAQYAGISIDALKEGNAAKYISAYKNAYDLGAFPAWLLEYDKNILRSCDSNAILFVGGDAEYEPIQYLQVIKKYRKDVTVIPFGLLDRPWFVELLKRGSEDILRNIPLSLTRAQIWDMHPYKWDTLTINIPIPDKTRDEYKLTSQKVVKWEIIPDLKSEYRTFLSAKRAVLLNIVQTNNWKRPIYFSLGCWPSFYAGLNNYLQLNGMANKLVPSKTKNPELNINVTQTERILLNEHNVKDFKDINNHNIPRVSKILGTYYNTLYRLSKYFKDQNNLEKIREIANYIKKNLLTDYIPWGNKVLQVITELETN